MKPRSGSASLAETSWFTWSKRVKWCSAWGEASRIAATGPFRSERTSATGTKLPRLRCMASPMRIRGGSHAQEMLCPPPHMFSQFYQAIYKIRQLGDLPSFPPNTVPPRRPAIGDGDGGKREREGHRSCVDSEVRSHSVILPFACPAMRMLPSSSSRSHASSGSAAPAGKSARIGSGKPVTMRAVSTLTWTIRRIAATSSRGLSNQPLGSLTMPLSLFCVIR